MAHRKIPDFFDPQSRRLTEDVLAGRTPLVDVNRPGVSPNVLRFFQDPRNRPTAQAPLAGGLDRVNNQARVDREAARTPVPTTRGTPQRRGSETQGEMAIRLERGGLAQGTARDTAARRFQFNTDLEQRRAARVTELEQRAARRKDTGLNEAQRETQRRIALRRGGPSFLAEINQRRIAQGRNPFGPVVRQEPIQIDSIEEVDPSIHGSGQEFVTSDGDFFRFNNVNGVQSFTPLKIDPVTGRRILDEDRIELDEFKEGLTDDERRFRIQTVLESGTILARDLQSILNNVSGVGQAVRDGTTSEQTKQEQVEKLREDIDELLFDFAKAFGGFPAESRRQTEEEIKQQEAEAKSAVEEQKRREARFTAERAANSTLLKDSIKFLQDEAKNSARGGTPKPVTEDKIQAEFQRRKRLLQSATPRDITDTTASGEFQTSAESFQQVTEGLDETPEEVAARHVGEDKQSLPVETLPNGETGFYSPPHLRVVSSREIQETAKNRGMTVEEVMKRLKIIPNG